MCFFLPKGSYAGVSSRIPYWYSHWIGPRHFKCTCRLCLCGGSQILWDLVVFVVHLIGVDDLVKVVRGFVYNAFLYINIFNRVGGAFLPVVIPSFYGLKDYDRDCNQHGNSSHRLIGKVGGGFNNPPELFRDAHAN